MTKEYQLPKEFAEKWVAALRSGEYQQGSESLCYNDSYCCLGVACAISGVVNVPHQDWIKATTAKDTSIPKILIGSAATSGLVYAVSTMNDSGSSFADIADWIEENVQCV